MPVNLLQVQGVVHKPQQNGQRDREVPLLIAAPSITSSASTASATTSARTNTTPLTRAEGLRYDFVFVFDFRSRWSLEEAQPICFSESFWR